MLRKALRNSSNRRYTSTRLTPCTLNLLQNQTNQNKQKNQTNQKTKDFHTSLKIPTSAEIIAFFFGLFVFFVFFVFLVSAAGDALGQLHVTALLGWVTGLRKQDYCLTYLMLYL